MLYTVDLITYIDTLMLAPDEKTQDNLTQGSFSYKYWQVILPMYYIFVLLYNSPYILKHAYAIVSNDVWANICSRRHFNQHPT